MHEILCSNFSTLLIWIIPTFPPACFTFNIPLVHLEVAIPMNTELLSNEIVL